MKIAYALLILLSSFFSSVKAIESVSLTPSELKKAVNLINGLQNKILMSGSQISDVDTLFSHYTEDFVYIHEVYGGTYTRQHLYSNYVKFLKAGDYQRKDDRYKVTAMIAGHNAISVERQEIYEGEIVKHLSVFEFKGHKVSKIIEYWK
ncbi:hypothetical protein [Pseudoalteromonas luteoviolacea]|uniref:SnoaL-like domain-containing protein n=1 Tax=Pseudoalteromonas luteoviolacea (strain 2ta16) TaxID=1353533 RepID=V4HA87_PSEL2|nr:hypothetical protein [Pseudoalteromonas luteoviolacea]ESP94366.1 hypothetical protein PL2TA16_00366 [Pseudoalteromonas luteoviolacea 2ta16]KZN32060.1 hypothetical protein N483_02670 [Pseudoalteromonas luteoviolacea NCIMB 1944]